MRGMLVLRTRFPLRVTTPGDVANAGDITKVLNRIKIKDATCPSDPGTTLGTTSFGRVMSISGDPRDIQIGRKLIFGRATSDSVRID